MALTLFLAPLEILAYGDKAAKYYGSIRAFLEKQGTPVGSLDCILITNNEKEFNRIPNLKIDN